MAKTRFKQPNIVTIEYRQEQGDPDYGSCLWANFNFDLERYDLTIMSDCGNYAYSWVATPNSESFMHLMSRVDQGYLLDKIAARCQVNYDETLANVKALISSYGIDTDNPEDLEDHPELDMERVQDACDRASESESYEALLRAFKDTPMEICDGYDVISCIEMDFTANAKKIAQVFEDFIKPLCKQWLAKYESNL